MFYPPRSRPIVSIHAFSRPPKGRYINRIRNAPLLLTPMPLHDDRPWRTAVTQTLIRTPITEIQQEYLSISCRQWSSLATLIPTLLPLWLTTQLIPLATFNKSNVWMAIQSVLVTFVCKDQQVQDILIMDEFFTACFLRARGPFLVKCRPK